MNISREYDSVKTTNEYDAMNQLTKSVKTRSGETQYTQINTYNNAGQRISKTDNGVTTYYYYQGDVLLYTTDAGGNKTSQNVVGPQGNVITAIRYDNGQYAYFYNKDIRTSVTNIVDESGAGIVSYRYDEVTEQYYLNVRYYDSENLTFLTQDSYRGCRSYIFAACSRCICWKRSKSRGKSCKSGSKGSFCCTKIP